MSKYIGDVSAYAYAVSKGYTGTEEEFAELMASYADVGQTAVDAKDAAVAAKTAAQTAATTATNKASEATTAAQTATTKAGEAQTSAQTASNKASEASQSASQASGYAQTAETAKTDAQTAKTQADTARDEAVTAKTAAETAQGKAEDAQAAAERVAESIPSDYSQLSEDVSDLKSGLTAIEKPSRNLYEIDPSYKSTLGGITVEASTNQVIVRGTATANVSFVLPTVFEMTANQKYTFSGCPDGGGENTYRMDVRNETSDSLASTASYDYGSGFVGYFSTTKRIRLGIRVVSGTTIDATFKPMILEGEMLGTDFIPHLTAYDDIARATNDRQDASIESINTAVSNIDTNLKNATGYNLNYGRNALTFVPGTDGSTLTGMLDNSFSYVIFNWFQDLGSDFPLSPTATGFLYKFGNRTQSGTGAVKLLIAIDTNGNTAKGKITGSGVIQWFSGGASDITVAMFGDSITWGRDGASSSAIQVNETIPMIVNEMLGVNTTNYGVGSQGWITTRFISTTALDNIKSRDLSGADVITLAYGINDSDSPLGVYTDTGTTTIMGCIYNALQEIYRQNPSVTIILIAPFGSVTSGIAPVWLDNTARPGGWTLVEMREEYRKFAEYYHLPYVSCADAPINRFTPREMLPDGIHPNQQAYIILGRYIAGQISRFIC